MSRRDNAHRRCPSCRMHGSLCLCDLLPRLSTRSRLLLVIHRSEARKPSNTGQIAAACLTNSEVLVRGNEEAPPAPFVAEPGTQPLFLFPHEQATPLATFARSGKPVTLIVPDGTWRQASKVRNRVPGFREVPCVSLPQGAPSTYRLRFEAHGHGLATMEAIGRAFGVLEGPEVEAAMDRVFKVMVERSLWSRGELETGDLSAPLPEGAQRHDPESGVRAELFPRSGTPPRRLPRVTRGGRSTS